MKPCKHCCSSGNRVGLPIYHLHTTTGGPPAIEIPTIKCPFCDGKGWIDEEEIFSVPRKYIKDEFFSNPYSAY